MKMLPDYLVVSKILLLSLSLSLSHIRAYNKATYIIYTRERVKYRAFPLPGKGSPYSISICTSINFKPYKKLLLLVL